MSMTRSAHGITSMIQKRLDKLGEIDRVTLKQGKTHRGRGLITDPIAQVVTPSGVESIEMHLPLTSKYGNRVQLATYTSYILLVCIATS